MNVALSSVSAGVTRFLRGRSKAIILPDVRSPALVRNAAPPSQGRVHPRARLNLSALGHCDSFKSRWLFPPLVATSTPAGDHASYVP